MTNASTKWRTWCGTLLTLLVMSSAMPLAAQLRPVSVTGRFGLVGASDDYQTNCGHSSIAVGVDVRGAGRVFPVVNADHFVGSGGGDVACLIRTDGPSRVRGGLQLERTTRLHIGAGSFVGNRFVRLEGTVRGGAALGRPGVFIDAGLPIQREHATGEARLLPQVGGDVSLVLFRYAVIAMAFDWTRLSSEVTPLAGGATVTSKAWSRMTSVQFGVRVGGAR
jgi:hypothetical protein